LLKAARGIYGSATLVVLFLVGFIVYEANIVAKALLGAVPDEYSNAMPGQAATVRDSLFYQVATHNVITRFDEGLTSEWIQRYLPYTTPHELLFKLEGSQFGLWSLRPTVRDDLTAVRLIVNRAQIDYPAAFSEDCSGEAIPNQTEAFRAYRPLVDLRNRCDLTVPLPRTTSLRAILSRSERLSERIRFQLLPFSDLIRAELVVNDKVEAEADASLDTIDDRIVSILPLNCSGSGCDHYATNAHVTVLDPRRPIPEPGDASLDPGDYRRYALTFDIDDIVPGKVLRLTVGDGDMGRSQSMVWTQPSGPPAMRSLSEVVPSLRLVGVDLPFAWDRDMTEAGLTEEVAWNAIRNSRLSLGGTSLSLDVAALFLACLLGFDLVGSIGWLGVRAVWRRVRPSPAASAAPADDRKAS